MTTMTQADFLRQIEDAKAHLKALALLYPGAFDADGNPIVAVACLPAQKPIPPDIAKVLADNLWDLYGEDGEDNTPPNVVLSGARTGLDGA